MSVDVSRSQIEGILTRCGITLDERVIGVYIERRPDVPLTDPKLAWEIIRHTPGHGLDAIKIEQAYPTILRLRR